MKASELKTVVIAGAGTMGAGIAGEFARAGCNVRLVDRNDALLDAGMKSLRRAQDVLVSERIISRAHARAALKRVRLVPKLSDACAGAELFLETVTEDLKVKDAVFAEADDCCPRDAVFATNTSSLSITRIAQAVRRPARLAGMNYANPPHVVPLVEVTMGKRTSPVTARFLVDVARRLGKRPVLIKRDIPGLISNRLQFAVMREALHILSEGIASAEDIDTAMSAGPGFRYALIGPLRTADLGGLDVFHKISQYLFPKLNSAVTPPPAMGKLLARGCFGAKSGEGFYKYPPAELKRILERRDRVLLQFRKTLQRFDASG